MPKRKISSKPITVVSPKRIAVAPLISREQAMLKEMFGSGTKSWGTGRNMPQMNQALTSGQGIINSGDDEQETASMFGL